jgi:hypothetical protein
MLEEWWSTIIDVGPWFVPSGKCDPAYMWPLKVALKWSPLMGT